jgi:uncharacterized protein
MTVTTALALLAAGIGGGLASTIASVVSYPILLSLGLPPLSANVTNTVSLVLTGLGSVLGSRPELAGQRARVIRRLPVRGTAALHRRGRLRARGEARLVRLPLKAADAAPPGVSGDGGRRLDPLGIAGVLCFRPG